MKEGGGIVLELFLAEPEEGDSEADGKKTSIQLSTSFFSHTHTKVFFPCATDPNQKAEEAKFSLRVDCPFNGNFRSKSPPSLLG